MSVLNHDSQFHSNYTNMWPKGNQIFNHNESFYDKTIISFKCSQILISLGC